MKTNFLHLSKFCLEVFTTLMLQNTNRLLNEASILLEFSRFLANECLKNTNFTMHK